MRKVAHQVLEGMKTNQEAVEAIYSYQSTLVKPTLTNTPAAVVSPDCSREGDLLHNDLSSTVGFLDVRPGIASGSSDTQVQHLVLPERDELHPASPRPTLKPRLSMATSDTVIDHGACKVAKSTSNPTALGAADKLDSTSRALFGSCTPVTTFGKESGNIMMEGLSNPPRESV